MKLLEALTFAVGKEIQEVGGRPMVFVTANFAPGDTVLHVSTTLGLHDVGVVWSEGEELAYTHRTPTTLNGVDKPRSRTIHRGAEVESSTKRLIPAAYELFWPASPAAAEFYGTDHNSFLRVP